MVQLAIANIIQSKEEARMAAVINKDYDALKQLLRDDLTHIHSNGHNVSKQDILQELRDEFDFLEIERGPLNIRVNGPSALVVGEVRQKVRFKLEKTLHHVHANLTQVWLHDEGDWRLAAFHASVVQRDIFDDLSEATA